MTRLFAPYVRAALHNGTAELDIRGIPPDRHVPEPAESTTPPALSVTTTRGPNRMIARGQRERFSHE